MTGEVVASRRVTDDGDLAEVLVGPGGAREVVTPAREAIGRLGARQGEIRELLDAMVTRWPELKAAR